MDLRWRKDTAHIGLCNEILPTRKAVHSECPRILAEIDDDFAAITAQWWEAQKLRVQRLDRLPERAGSDRQTRIGVRKLGQALQHVYEVTLLESYVAEVPAEFANVFVGEMSVPGIDMFAGEAPHEVDHRIVPQSLMKNRPAPRRQHTKKLCPCSGILDDMVQHAEADDEIEGSVSIAEFFGIHLFKLG